MDIFGRTWCDVLLKHKLFIKNVGNSAGVNNSSWAFIFDNENFKNAVSLYQTRNEHLTGLSHLSVHWKVSMSTNEILDTTVEMQQKIYFIDTMSIILFCIKKKTII